ncbi:Putative uncharacterized protein [Halomonas sp. R57-5]|nr:Putative uncharacterized protein [Halomonas sp. R57-5]
MDDGNRKNRDYHRLTKCNVSWYITVAQSLFSYNVLKIVEIELIETLDALGAAGVGTLIAL